MDIAPGSKIKIEILGRPTALAARKTLTRVCRKDAEMRHLDRRRKEQRPSLQKWQRGGRMWEHRMKTKPPVKLAAGETFSVLASVDVVRDLRSIARWVKVSSL
jgi:hypothetical protein